MNKFNSKIFKKRNDITVSAIPGIAGLKPTLEMLNVAKILIANKESIICGWNLIKNLALKKKQKLFL